MLAVRPALALLGSLALVLAVVGCGGSGDDAATTATTPAVPAGLRATSTPAFVVGFPPGWTTRPGATGPGEVQTIAQGPAGPSGIRPGAVVGASARAGADPDVLAQVNAADTRLRQPSARVGSARPIAVAGARGARVIESRVAAVPAQDGASRAVDPGTSGSIVVHQWDVVVQTRSGAAVNLYLFVPEPDASRVPVRDILRSLTVR